MRFDSSRGNQYTELMEFHEFCEKVLQLKLTIGQRVIAKVCFGDYNPEDLEGREKVLALEMFGGLGRVSGPARKFILLRLGRGSGKTTLCAAYAVYVAVTADCSMSGPGDVPRVISVAPDKALATQGIMMARELIRNSVDLERLVEKESATDINIRRRDGKLVRIEALAASKGGSSVRGKTILSFIMDEAEFFNSDEAGGFAVNDRDIFKSLKPRLVKRGKGMLISTPWPSENMMSEMFDRNWLAPKDAVAVLAPTLLVRGDDPDIRELVEQELANDPDNALREFFCEKEGLSKHGWFDSLALKEAKQSYQFPYPRNNRYPCAAAADFGFERDSSTLAIVQYDGHRYILSSLIECRPSKDSPLKPGEVVKRFAEECLKYGIRSIVADQFHRASVREHLDKYGIGIIPAPEGSKGKEETHIRTKVMLGDGRIVIPDSPEGKRLIEQAKLVTGKAMPGGRISIKSPRRAGLNHGDLVSSWVLAVHRLEYGVVHEPSQYLEPGSPEWNAEFQRLMLEDEKKRMQDYLKRTERDVSRRLGKRGVYKALGGAGVQGRGKR